MKGLKGLIKALLVTTLFVGMNLHADSDNPECMKDPDPLLACILTGKSLADLWQWRSFTAENPLTAKGYDLDQNDHFLCRAKVVGDEEWRAGYLIHAGKYCQLITNDVALEEFQIPTGVGILQYEWQRADQFEDPVMNSKVSLNTHYYPAKDDAYSGRENETWCRFETSYGYHLGVIKPQFNEENLCVSKEGLESPRYSIYSHNRFQHVDRTYPVSPEIAAAGITGVILYLFTKYCVGC